MIRFIMALTKHPLFAALAILFVIVAGLGGVFGGLAAFGVADEVQYKFGTNGAQNYEGSVVFKGGMNNDGSTYISSWHYDGNSELITAQGSITGIAGGANLAKEQGRAPTKILYKLWLRDRVIDEQEHEYNSAPTEGKTVPAPVYTKRIKGMEQGNLKIEMLVWSCKTYPVFGFSCTDKGWTLAAQDGARILLGAGSVKLDGKSDVFEEGQRVTFKITTGEGKWRLKLFDGVGKERCLGTFGGAFALSIDSILAQKTGSSGLGACSEMWTGSRNGAKYSFQIPANSFRSDGQNKWRMVLENEIIEQSAEDFVTIDKKAAMPEPAKTVVDNANPAVGERVVFDLKSRANPTTNAAITSFLLCSWYGSDNVVPASGSSNDLGCVNVPASKVGDTSEYKGSYTLTVDRAAKVQYRVYAVDSAGRMSGSQLDNADRQVLVDAGLVDPNDQSRGTIATKDAEAVGPPAAIPGETTSPTTTVLLIVAALIISMLVWVYVPVQPYIRIVAIAGVVGGVVWVVLGGV